MDIKLGKLKRIDLREVWKNEASDFTPWLVENIEMLSDLLGMELEVVQREAEVGDFAADILARDLGRNRVVIIENQIEATDHSHLGQLITYAAGLEASAVVWISRDFREEHRQALDWLNRGDEASTEFFGVVIEALAIDSSAPAANLRLVASPNNWSRQSKAASGVEEPSEKMNEYRNFFQQLIDELRAVHFTNAKAGQPQNWYSFASGTSGFTFGMSFASGDELRAEVYLKLPDRAKNKAAFDALFARKDQLEAQFGEPLRWERLDHRHSCRIACYTAGSIEDPADKQEQHRKWAVEHLLKFKKVFGPLLSGLAAQ